jgi:hypothetical protein
VVLLTWGAPAGITIRELSLLLQIFNNHHLLPNQFLETARLCFAVNQTGHFGGVMELITKPVPQAAHALVFCYINPIKSDV